MAPMSVSVTHPVRVRAGWVTDTDIGAMAYQITEDTAPLALEAGAA